jgi:hypothetical protein
LLLVLTAVAGTVAFALANSGLALADVHAPAARALRWVVGAWGAAMVIALALCRMAAGADRAMVDAERTAALSSDPELAMRFSEMDRLFEDSNLRQLLGALERDRPSLTAGPRAAHRPAPRP